MLEAPVAGYIADIARDDLLIEIQTRHFAAIKNKLADLLKSHAVMLAHPIAAARWLLTYDEDGRRIKRRKSPKRGHVTHLFSELVYLPDEILSHPRFSVCVLMTHDEEIRVDDGRGSWRRRGISIQDRRLLEVTASHHFRTPADYRALLPATLSAEFTTRGLAEALGQPRRIAQQMAYCLHRMAIIQRVAKRGNAHVYAATPVDDSNATS